jgi:hypothetical protein
MESSVVNLSLRSADSYLLREAVLDAYLAGILMAAAVGNSNEDEAKVSYL